MKRSLTIFLLGCFFYLANTVEAKDSWRKVQSKNFTVVGSASESDMRKLAVKLEQFREVLGRLFPKLDVVTSVPTTVVLFKTDDAFRPFKPRYQGKIRDNVGGYFLPGAYVNYIALAADKQSLNSDQVIFHEYEHFVVGNNLTNIPLWLDEGMAEFYSTFQTDGEQTVKIGSPIGYHVFYLRDHPIIPLKTLMLVDHKSPAYNEGSRAGTFYAESWALVHYLINGNQQKRQPQLVKFINLLLTGLSPEESFQKAFEADFKTIQGELTNYISHFSFPYLTITFRNQLAADKEMKTTLLSEAESDFYQGDLLLNMGLMPEAKSLLEKAIEIDPHLSAPNVSLGIIRLREHDIKQAAELFRVAVENDPANYLAHYFSAEALELSGQNEEAINAYKHAIALKPDFARAYTGLGATYLRIGNEGEAIKSFEAGVRNNSQDGSLYRTMAYFYLARAHGDDAAGAAYRYLSMKGWRDAHAQYMALVWYFAIRTSKREAFATKILNDSLAKSDPTDWPYPIFLFLDHKLTVAELDAKANDNDKQTEFHTYVGLQLLFDGDADSALGHLRWVRDNGNKDFVEYPLALAAIARAESVKPE